MWRREPSSPKRALNSLLCAERCSVERSGATCAWRGEKREYGEAGAVSDADDYCSHVGFLQIERHFEDFLDGDVELHAHGFEGEKRRGEGHEFGEEGALAFLGCLRVKVGRVEEQNGVVQLDCLLRDRFFRRVKLDRRLGLVPTGEREAEGNRVVDGQRAVVETVHLVVELGELPRQLRSLQLLVQHVLL